METLKVAYVDFWPEWPQENFIDPILKKRYNVIPDFKNPDVVFHSIFGGMRETPKYRCKRIQILGENRRPWSGSHYSISFDPPTFRNYQLPLWQVYLLLNPKLKEIFFKKPKVESFKFFAAFIVSNGNNPIRNGAFYELSQYKFVKSYGRYLTNDPGLIQYSQGKYWREAKYNFFKYNTHKFMFAFENNSYPNYCTEKLMDAFLAGSIPIYWGDPQVKKDWNERAFINFSSGWMDEIKKLDQDSIAFEEKYKEPIFTPDQAMRHLENIEGFKDWLIEKINS